MKYFLAIDIGASSGRHIVGWKRCGKTYTEEVYRFPNGVKEENGHLVWDVQALTQSVVNGIKAAFEKYPKIESLSIDTWGVDYVLFNGDEEIMPCYAYRDSRTEKVIDKVHEIIPFETLYARTGIQFQPFNTIYQLYDDKLNGRLDNVTDFLMIPEYLSYKLTGVKRKEYTNATTTGLLDAKTGEYDKRIIAELGLKESLFGAVYQPKTVVGELKPEIAEMVGGNTTVVLCASHDTASAVEGIPMTSDNPYISSGTWSLLGVKAESAITDENSRLANYSNEGGIGYIRYQKNIMGMWVINSLRKELCPDKPFPQIVEEAKKSDFLGIADVNDSSFLAPTSMKAAFDAAFEGSAEKPKKDCDYFNCAYRSLAESYRVAIAELEKNTGKKYDELYIVGGGAKNAYLNALTQAACQIKVTALPIEATALGNLKIQMERK